jgi:sec-independent protein translocase protein TatA
MGMPSMPELIIILLIIVLLFGAKKIPDLAKGLGSGIKNFKKAMKEDEEETTVAANDKTEQIKKSESTEAKSETKAEDATKA